MEREAIENHPAFAQPWYYVVELAPGLSTPGTQRPNLGLTRNLLHNVDVAGARCLDVGTMEGVVPVLLERRGAEVVAYDRVFSAERLTLLRDALQTRFELIGEPIEEHVERLWLGRGGPTPGVGMPLGRLPAALADRGHGPFDLVVFSGFLYHVYDPLAALATVRGLVRDGGIVIVETAATFDGNLSLNLNAAARFSPLAIWLPSVACLDYLLRLVRLEPIEVVYYGRARGRIAVACRAVEAGSATTEDEWITSPLHDYELAEYLDVSAIASDQPHLGYAGAPESPVDVLEQVRQRHQLRPPPDQQRLDLGARS